MIFPEVRTISSMALGRENVVHVALTDPAAVRVCVTRLLGGWLSLARNVVWKTEIRLEDRLG